MTKKKYKRKITQSQLATLNEMVIMGPSRLARRNGLKPVVLASLSGEKAILVHPLTIKSLLENGLIKEQEEMVFSVTPVGIQERERTGGKGRVV